jgi:hypothetical protein
MMRVVSKFPKSEWASAVSVFMLVRRVRRTDQLAHAAVQVAAEVPDDSQAVAAIKAVGGKSKSYKLAAEYLRRDRYRYEHRNGRRAVRLLEAVADGSGPPAVARGEDESLFRAVDDLEAHPAEEAFAMLAEEVPALWELERQLAESRSAEGWVDRDADPLVRGILGSLDRLVGPEAPRGSPLVRSATAHRCARVHLLGTVGLLLEDREAGPEEKAALLAVLARGYGVKPDIKPVTRAIRRRVGDRDGFRTMAVLSVLLWERGMGERLRRGGGLSDSSRKSVATTLVSNGYPSSAELVDRITDEVRSVLARVSRDEDDC